MGFSMVVAHVRLKEEQTANLLCFICGGLRRFTRIQTQHRRTNCAAVDRIFFRVYVSSKRERTLFGDTGV